jgi:hypothetical protein
MARKLSGVSFLGDADPSVGALSADARAPTIEIQERRAVIAGRLGVGTLACARCDAPVALGGEPRPLTDRLTCPFCGHSGPARDFLSLGVSRPARVAVWVTPRVSAA